MKTKIILLLVLVLLLAGPVAGFEVDLFSKSNCSPCDNARGYLDYLDKFITGMEIVEYNETYLGGGDFDYFNQTAAQKGFSNARVPAIVVYDDYIIGYTGSKKEKDRIKEMVLKGKNREQNLKEQEEQQEQSPTTGQKVTLQLFWSKTCPHCEAEKEFLSKIAPKYPELDIQMYEVTSDENNLQLLKDTAKELGFETDSVPVTIIDGWHRIGYGTDSVEGKQIENVIKLKIAEMYERSAEEQEQLLEKIKNSNFETELPFIGVVDSRELGIPLSTIIFGLADGFNPCAFFVLTMLLTFLGYANSRKRMLLIGGIFVFISGFVYFLAMAAMYGAMASIEQFTELSFIAGIIAIVIGLINVKDFFFFKKGVSLSVSDDKKSKLYRRMRDLLKKESMVAVVVSTIILAFVANSYELLCTATIPFVYNNLLLSENLDLGTALTFILLYCAVYVIPLIMIVLLFIRKLSVEKTSQEKGEALKAISGFMMLGFGFFLLIDPHILSNIVVTGSLIGFSIIISWVMMKAKKCFSKEEKGEPEDNESKVEENADDKK